LLPPRAPPNGETTWAASPMKIVRADLEVIEQVVAVLVRADPDELELDVGAQLLAQSVRRRPSGRLIASGSASSLIW